MSTSIITLEDGSSSWVSRIADFIELTKPRIAVLILIIVAISSYVARWGHPDVWSLMHALFGTLLVASSASALNQWIERRSDALMNRTSDRPLPAGRLTSKQVLSFAAVTVVAGLLYLAVVVNWQAAAWGLLTWFLYVWVYTPMKSRTSWNTAVGAIAGALPVLIGWSAVGGAYSLSDPRGLALFGILFLWQFPHFMAIAWIYRRQYGDARMLMLTVTEPSGHRAGVQAVSAALALLPASFVPALMSTGYGTSIYLVAAFVLGVGQLTCAIRFFLKRDDATAKWLLRASLIYLPALFVFLIFTTLV